MTEYELYHHGIKGQKWGVRRFQNPDGSWTAAHRVASAASKTGKVLYKGASKAGKATGKAVGKGAKIAKKAAVAKVKKEYKEHKEKAYYKKLHKKKLSQMTDKEIADLTKRVKVEAGLKDAKYESRVQNARKFYKNVAEKPVNTIIATYSKNAIEAAFKTNSKDDSDDSGNGSKNKGSNKNKDNDDNINVNFEVVKERPQRVDKKPKRGTANPYNNPVIIRHGR